MHKCCCDKDVAMMETIHDDVDIKDRVHDDIKDRVHDDVDIFRSVDTWTT